MKHLAPLIALLGSQQALAQTAPPVPAGRADENAVTQAEDAFGTSIGSESVGIYNSFDVRGFSPTRAGNVRVEGLYYDQVWPITLRLRRSTTIRIGISAQGFPFPAPTGVVDYALRKPGAEASLSVVASGDSYGAAFTEFDAVVPLVKDTLSLGAGVGFYANEFFNATNSLQHVEGMTLRWTPSPDVEVIPFWSRSDIYDDEIGPQYLPAGSYLPPRVKRRQYDGPQWVEYEGTASTYGGIGRFDLSDDWQLRGGLFRSFFANSTDHFAFVTNLTPDGRGNYLVFADPPNKLASTSGDARGLSLSGEQRTAFDHATDGKDLGVVIGYAGTGKSAMLGVTREAWEDAGFKVRGAALSGIAAESLEAGSAIPSRTIASLEHQWGQGRELLTARDVLVIDEAGMIGSRQMERVLSAANEAGAKVLLVGDPQQLQAIEAGAAFRSIAERHGGVEITEIRRQQIDWQRDATRHLATERTAEALQAYSEHDMVHVADTREGARAELVKGWESARRAFPDQSQIILTHTNDEVRGLNELARGKLREAGALGEDVTINTERGPRQFATGDRIMFLRNDRELGVKNGSLGEIERVSPQRMTVKLDDGRNVNFDTKNYPHVDHGYAATIHKAQGVTVDRTHVLATPGLDRHASYVALSRHRESMSLHYGKDDFADTGKLARTLSRERAKDMASDYAREGVADPAQRFAERRGISFRERVAEVVRKVVPEKARSIFAGFRPAPEAQQDTAAEQKAKAGPLDIERGVERYARAEQDIDRMRQKGLAPMPHQETAIDKARAALNEMKLKAGRDLAAAFSRQPELVAEAANGRTTNAIRAMQLETEIRTNPAMRADRFVSDWQRLHRQRDQAFDAGKYNRANAVTSSMGAMAKQLERDVQVDSLLRNRRIELGLHTRGSGGIGRELTEYLGLGRGRGISIGM